MRLAIVIGAVALGGCVSASADMQRGRDAAQTREAAELARALDGRVAGTPQNCISNMSASGPQIIGERTLLYRQGGKVWRNDLPESCPGLDDDDLLVIEIHGSQLCRNDRFRADSRMSVVPGPSCRLGSFTPYTKR